MARVPAEQRRRQLLSAALRVVATEGVAAASTRRIAGEAKLPPAVVHYCFRSIEDLLDAVTALLFGEMAESAAVALRVQGGVEPSIKAALHGLWAPYRADPARYKAVFDLVQYALRRPSATMIVRAYEDRICGLAERFLLDVAERNNTTLRDPAEVIGRVLLSTVDGVVLAWLIDRDDAKTEAALDWLATSIAAGITDNSARS
ncbi:TetR family transcriptional regulator [Kibdelosporangium philippinense]|uniref:TetR family transcriptional regulator n=1 Tax=Kibdelosporangium philippinense TaxID=211113 RepID=A0ABS8Z450_9PSEU|nr:TetR family transcriptional regulator [Kibdelosporangium philippinense]MCE7002704.1 TetR family transcriptional regulator [Kibdelosporangium philippinense]